MQFLQFIFWFSFILVFYNYIGYAVIAYFFTHPRNKKRNLKPDTAPPSVSFIVAAYNEEDCIENKIANSLEQRFPSEKLEYIFITDGSSDRTAAIIEKYPSIKLLHSPDRKGKSAALNRAVLAARNEILIFSDANTILNKDAVKNITRHYDSKEVGGVAGEKKVMPAPGVQNAVASEGMYWKYESFLKKIDSDFHSVVGAAGELFSLRKALYEPVPPHVILDDFVISMKVAEQGYRIIYEPEAYAMELPSFSIKEEKKRKIRIAAGGFQAIAMLPGALRFWHHGKLSFLYISHRVLRWTASPLCLILAFISNFLLSTYSSSFLYRALFFLQAGFYLGGLLAFISPFLANRLKLLKLPYYFIFMNISVIQGFFRFLRRNQPSTWEKVRRSSSNLVENQL